MLHVGALHRRPYDGHTLEGVLAEQIDWTGITPERIYVDRGYRGHSHTPANRVFRSGQKRGMTGTIKQELRRRCLVEPIIGHLKSDRHLGRNYLKGELGDKKTALLTAVGYNFRLLLKWFRRLCQPQKRGVSLAKLLSMACLDVYKTLNSQIADDGQSARVDFMMKAPASKTGF